MAPELERNGTYIIVNVKSGTALDLSGADGKSISGWERNDGDNQKAFFFWQLLPDKGLWMIYNVTGGRFIGIQNGPLNNGRVIQSDAIPIISWEISPDSENFEAFRISVPGEEWDVDLSEGNSSNGTRVILWERRKAGTNQTWRFFKV
ncbi:hypothetical protein H0H87_007442 [Tephrocybe sp. NHM501043]|nr:hypothetical protein H0H87_007442 [Tephrocybe sp. NHM501043]